MTSNEIGLRIEAEFLELMGEEAYAQIFSPDGMARQTEWLCRDGWLVGYTTSRIRHGRNDGKFAAFAFKPIGKGARGGRRTATSWKRVYFRAFAKRKTARARAEQLYHQHQRKPAA